MDRFLHRRLVRLLAFALVGAAVIGAVALAVLVHLHPAPWPDIAISRELQEQNNGWFLGVMRFVSWFGTPWVAALSVVATALCFLAFRHRREAFYVMTTLAASGVNALLKLVVERPRPAGTLVTAYQALTDSSFPSGHVVHYVVFFGFLAFVAVTVETLPLGVRVALAGFSLPLVALVSISRIYLGAHWASDVIGGYLIGFVFLAVLLYSYLSSGAAHAPERRS